MGPLQVFQYVCLLTQTSSYKMRTTAEHQPTAQQRRIVQPTLAALCWPGNNHWMLHGNWQRGNSQCRQDRAVQQLLFDPEGLALLESDNLPDAKVPTTSTQFTILSR